MTRNLIKEILDLGVQVVRLVMKVALSWYGWGKIFELVEEYRTSYFFDFDNVSTIGSLCGKWRASQK